MESLYEYAREAAVNIFPWQRRGRRGEGGGGRREERREGGEGRITNHSNIIKEVEYAKL